MSKNTYIIDFDSTFTQVEALDELAKISLKDSTDQNIILEEIEALTNLAMEGKLSFTESLEKRIQLLDANTEHLKKLISRLKKKVSKSFSRNELFLKTHASDILIISGGFKEFIEPVVKKYHIPKENIYANTFDFAVDGSIVGYDKNNPLSKEGGKVELIKQLNLSGTLYGIGDGYSDFQLRESGLIKKFYAFTENISRDSIIKHADHITPSFDEFLYLNNLPSSISYPKNRILCLLVGEVPQETLDILKRDGFSIRHKTEIEEKYIADIGMLILGSNEKVSNEILAKANKLKVIGHLGGSSKSLNLELATERAIVVFDNEKEKKNGAIFIPNRVKDFINTGSTDQSVNFPKIQLPKIENTHRLIHIHENVPGVMAQINTTFANNQINIVAQFLLTNKKIGFCITDIDKNYNKSVIKDLKKIQNTIKFRILY